MKRSQRRELDQQVNIEILRTRAMLERETLAVSVQRLGTKFGFASLWGGGARRSSLGVLAKAVGLLSQHPFVFSAVSGLLVKSKFRWLKAIGLSAVALFAYRGATDQRTRGR